MQPLNKFVV